MIFIVSVRMQMYMYTTITQQTPRQRSLRTKGAIVREEYRQGKGNVIRSMFRDIDADCYIMVDGDDTYPAEDAWQAAQMVLEGRADMCIGDRLSSTYFVENKRVFHNMGNRMVRFLINWIFTAIYMTS